MYYEVELEVNVRKYEVDMARLNQMIRDGMKRTGINKFELSQLLDVPVTTVEHWVRKDKYQSIPEPEL